MQFTILYTIFFKKIKKYKVHCIQTVIQTSLKYLYMKHQLKFLTLGIFKYQIIFFN